MTASLKSKKRTRGPPFADVAGCPGGAETPPGLVRLLLGLLSLLRLLRLFCLLRFLSHSILFWVNGWKRDTRHAWRRADLATSSMTIPTDSQAAAPYCHTCVITLSTAVMRFGVVSAPRCASHPRIFAVVQRTHRPQRLVRVNTAPTQSRNCASIDPLAVRAIFIDSKPRRECSASVRSPLSAAAACCPQDYGDSQGWLFGNWGDRTMRVLVSRC